MVTWISEAEHMDGLVLGIETGREKSMAEKPSSEPVRLTKETKVKHPETGENLTLAAGTEVSAATAERLGLRKGK
jgi:hypothetical protein